MANKPTYKDFGYDIYKYFIFAYAQGFRYNDMVSQAQRAVECWLKQLITNSLMNNNEVMLSHNLRNLYDYVVSLGINISSIRADVMLLNNFYTHTRYPGKDAFMASDADIESCQKALLNIIKVLHPLM